MPTDDSDIIRIMIPEEDIPDEEERFLEDMGLAADGTRMQTGDLSWDGSPWYPDKPEN